MDFQSLNNRVFRLENADSDGMVIPPDAWKNKVASAALSWCDALRRPRSVDSSLTKLLNHSLFQTHPSAIDGNIGIDVRMLYGDHTHPSPPRVELAHGTAVDGIVVFTHQTDANPRHAINRSLNRKPDA
jgi:hypothetical protein